MIKTEIESIQEIEVGIVEVGIDKGIKITITNKIEEKAPLVE